MGACARNWLFYARATCGVLGLSLAVNLCCGTDVGWSLVAYYAWFHFAKQPFGLVCLYKLRYGERNPRDHQWDYWTCMAGAGIPFLLWHAGAFGRFRWFAHEERKLFELPGVLLGPLWALYIILP